MCWLCTKSGVEQAPSPKWDLLVKTLLSMVGPKRWYKDSNVQLDSSSISGYPKAWTSSHGKQRCPASDPMPTSLPSSPASHLILLVKKTNKQTNKKTYPLHALAGIAQWIGCGPVIKGFPVRFPVRTHAWVVDQVPGRGVRGNHTLMFLSLFLSL